MRNTGIGIAIIAALIGTPALAADMAFKAPPPPAPTLSWTGCHVGVTVGGSWMNSGGFTNDAGTTIGGGPLNPLVLGTVSSSLSSSGAIGGAYVGCDYQVNAWVIGIEGDWSALNQTGNAGPVATTNAVLAAALAGDFWALQEQWLATARGRAGYTVNNWLLYVTGGAAWMRVTSTQGISVSPLFTDTQTDTRTGWTIGAGFEYALNNSWSIRGEYLYVNIPTYRTFTPGNGVPGFALLDDFLNEAVRLNDNIVRVGLSYKIGP